MGFNKDFHPSKRVASQVAIALMPPQATVISVSRKNTSCTFVLSLNLNLLHDKMISSLMSNDLCLNYLHPGHFVKNCCKKCQRHTLLHIEAKKESVSLVHAPPPPSSIRITSHASYTMVIKSNLLFMTSRVLIKAPDASLVEA